jgi:hypothetical protein
MPSIGPAPGEESSAGAASKTCSPVSGVHAQLRQLPGDPCDFRVVVSFLRADGSNCEAELTPVDAAGLMSEIALEISLGNASAPKIASFK